MLVIYDLDNEYGGRIIGDVGESSDGVLKVVSADAGIPALNVARTTTGNAPQAPFRIQGTSVASGALNWIRWRVHIPYICSFNDSR